MLEFTSIPRISLKKINTDKRIKNFKEIYIPYNYHENKEQAKRCMSCGIPYCTIGCPLHNMIPLWLKRIADKDLSTAFDISNSTSPFPEILGRICPHDILCEGACSLNTGHGAVSIGSVESSILDKGFKNGLKVKFGENKIKLKTKVAIIGSGPAGLSCATYLLRVGIGVEMFERASLAGGLLTYGIPNFKLDKQIVQNRISMLESAGMKLHLNKEITNKDEFEKLYNDFDYIYLAMGATKSNWNDIKGLEAKNTYKAIDFLTSIQCEQFEQKPQFDIKIKNKNIVVIGGGDTAMDCVRSSIRKKANKITCIYRRSENDMRGSKKEYENALEEGVEFIFNASIKEANNNKLTIGTINENLEYVKCKDLKLKFNIVIMALGFTPNKYNFLNNYGVNIATNGRVLVDDKFKTSNDKIYCGGDLVQGASLAVIAAANGRDGAREIASLTMTTHKTNDTN